jgi:hypothetical protein
MKNYTYTYTNHKLKDDDKQKKIVIEADGIIEADEIYKEKTGLDPVKCTYIGCSVGVK